MTKNNSKNQTSNLPSVICNHLLALADKYENKEFLVGDPSWFMHQVKGETNKELLAFIASAISYGSRKQFLPKIESLRIEGDYIQWLKNRDYEAIVPHTDECFYRLYTKAMMNDFLNALALMIEQYGSMRGFMESVRESLHPTTKLTALEAVKAITAWFAEHGSVGVIPKDATSSCKRVCMFLRWMVRDNSPVDLGIWSDIIDKRTLIIPMDTHVQQEAVKLGLISSKSTSMTAALKLSQKLREIWPDDPIKGDFALFGAGVAEGDEN